MNKICQGCGKKFQCVGNEKCWCYDIRLKDSQILELKSYGNDCFCKNCLLANNSKLKP